DGTTALIGGPGDKSKVGAAWVFVNTPLPPTVETKPATAVAQSSATLNATVNPQGELVSDCHFNYGTSTSYESSIPCTTLLDSGDARKILVRMGTGPGTEREIHDENKRTHERDDRNPPWSHPHLLQWAERNRRIRRESSDGQRRAHAHRL